jgi:hypothetical protein
MATKTVPVLTLDEVDVVETLENILDREPTEDEVSEAISWLQKDFDWSDTFARVELILKDRRSKWERSEE